ncbi:MAG: hypothetical protein PVG39_23145 [Desulfobacteraceae bacterium]|jgi:hypothetical protein
MANINKELEQYILINNDILIGFQYVEESIRLYLSEVYKYISAQISDVLPFSYGYNDLEKNSLGRLVKKFEKLNDNKQLISELKHLTPHRNESAHRGFLLQEEQLSDEAFFNRKLVELVEIRDRTTKCVNELYKQIARIKILNG